MATNRLPRLHRAAPEEVPGIRLTPRDAAILLAVYQYWVLTTLHLQALFFSNGSHGSHARKPGKINTRCQHRLQLLYHHGYLRRFEQPQTLADGRRPFLYSLDGKGAQLVGELLDGEELHWSRRDRNQTISSLFLEHLLASNDVRVAVTMAARRYGFKILTWLDERALKSSHIRDTVTIIGPSGQERQVALIPDGYFLLDTGAHLYSCFLEVDRATSTATSSVWGRRDWARKIAVYLEYYSSGKYQERYKVQGLRVLTVTTTEKRLANLKATAERAGGRSRFWFTTFERIATSDILTDPIWQVASREGFYKLVW